MSIWGIKVYFDANQPLLEDLVNIDLVKEGLLNFNDIDAEVKQRNLQP